MGFLADEFDIVVGGGGEFGLALFFDLGDFGIDEGAQLVELALPVAERIR